ncbi:MAG: hypothetical protein ACOY4R_26030 [Pseudomonadota bacterium]
MTSVAVGSPKETRLDLRLLRTGALYFALANVLVAPLAPDPWSLIAGAFTPFIILSLIGFPTMPKGIVFLLFWQWAQTFARALQAIVDGESMALSVYGDDILKAYWYVLSGLVTMAAVYRLMLGGIRPPTAHEYYWHERWRASDLVIAYFASIVASAAFAFAARLASGLDQPLTAAAQIKVVTLFLLCTYVLTTGRGVGMLMLALAAEILAGFTGFFSDFRAVFIYLAFAAVAARVKWTGTATLVSIAWVGLLVLLALFWTSVKMDYRSYVSGYDETVQQTKVPLDERMGYLLDKAISIGNTDWKQASYDLLIRFAYIDIFGQVIGVAQSRQDAELMPQWQAAVSHVLQPRFLFPDKAPLSDSDVFMRLTKADPNVQINAGTSISVGYIAENFVDLGFPGMLLGLAVLAAIISLVTRYFMSTGLPWMLREGIIMGFAFTVGGTGMEVSLPKILGAMLMFFIVWSLIAKFALPIAIRWLDQRGNAWGGNAG